MKKRKSFLQMLSVLLFSGLMLLPPSVALSPSKTLASMTTVPGGVAEISCPFVRDGAWDNGGIDGFQVGLSSQLDVVYPFNSQVVDDFRFNSTTAVAGVHCGGSFTLPRKG